LKNLYDIQLIDVPSFADKNGLLVAYNGGADFGLEINRVFVVVGCENTQRGKHAHKALTQILVCVHGICRVVCDDGKVRKEFILDKPNRALLVPRGIWAEQFYESKDPIVMVFCDLPYDEADYIRNYDAYLNFRKLGD
jgi:UDP-2-acetamido-3-amino-2,3-dideoxy-glucuronate N-acetyltransferase